MYYNLDEEKRTAHVTSSPNHYEGLETIVIPASVTYNEETYRVSSIGEGAFPECYDLLSVTLPDGLDSICGSAFFWCTELKSINLPSSLKQIKSNAYTGCLSLTALSVPSTDVKISYMAFTYVPNVIYPGDPGYLSWGARSVNGYVEDYWVFADNTKTTLLACSAAAEGDITIPASVTEMPRNSIGTTFYYCKKITSITIPSGIAVISSYAFEGCSSLQTVVLSNSITEIEARAFNNCKNLLSFTCKATTPPVMGNEVFFNVDCSAVPLYVPAESVDAYKEADQWKKFNPILPIEQGIDQISQKPAAKSQKLMKDGQLFILSGEREYTATGQRL